MSRQTYQTSSAKNNLKEIHMKPSREEVLGVLRGVCDPGMVDPVDIKRKWATLTLEELERFAAAMYAKGAADMKERAASRLDEMETSARNSWCDKRADHYNDCLDSFAESGRRQ